MNRKALLGTIALVVALGAGIALWLTMPPTPTTPSSGNTPADTNNAARSVPTDQPNAPRLERPATPDPVVDATPSRPLEMKELPLRLEVTGVVLDADGVGVGDARVNFIGVGKFRGLRGSGYSEPSGRYRLLAWMPGTVKPPGEVGSGIVVATVADGRRAISAEAEARRGVRAEMPELRLPASGTLAGLVVAPDSTPAAGAIVKVQSSGALRTIDFKARRPLVRMGTVIRQASCDERGVFEITGLPPGRYRISAKGGYFGANANAGTVEVGSTGSEWRKIILNATAYVRGRVLDASGRPVAGARMKLVAARPSDTRPDAGGDANRPTIGDFRRGDNKVGIRRFPHSAQRLTQNVSDELGRFAFFSRPDLEYVIEARLGLDTVRLEDVRINRDDYTLALPVSTGVSGVVRDAESNKLLTRYDIRVMRATTDDPYRASPFVRVAANRVFPLRVRGAYRLANLPAADLTLRVSAPGYAPAIVLLKDLAVGDSRRGVDISLAPLCEIRLELKLKDRLLDMEPVLLLFDGRLAFAASTDEAGRVRIPEVTPASYEIRVPRRDGTILIATVEVPAARAASLEVVLKAAD